MKLASEYTGSIIFYEQAQEHLRIIYSNCNREIECFEREGLAHIKKEFCPNYEAYKFVTEAECIAGGKGALDFVSGKKTLAIPVRNTNQDAHNDRMYELESNRDEEERREREEQREWEEEQQRRADERAAADRAAADRRAAEQQRQADARAAADRAAADRRAAEQQRQADRRAREQREANEREAEERRNAQRRRCRAEALRCYNGCRSEYDTCLRETAPGSIGRSVCSSDRGFCDDSCFSARGQCGPR